MLKYLDDFRLDKKKFRELSETRIKEFNMLNESVQNLLRTNIAIFNSQKQFIENASHELQTPLAIGINKLELLAGDSDLSSDQIRKIGEIIEALQRLSGLNKSLLLLSKIENKQFIAEGEVSFDEVFRRIIQDFSDFAEFQKIEINYLCENDWIYRINKDLAEMLVMNLVKNAITHNRKGGEVNIMLQADTFIIENTSNEPSMPSETLFERFSKKSKSRGSTGLGLAIVKAITDVSGLDVSYSYNGRHIFRVSRL
jgi:signal transduction histidine kinase